MTAAEVLKTISAHYGISIQEISQLAGYERPQALYDVIKGKTKHISPKMANNLADAFPELNSIFILTGEGEMLRPASVVQHGKANVHGSKVGTVVGEMHGVVGQVHGDFHSDEGKDQLIDEQKAEVNKMFDAIIVAINGFQKSNERHDEYVVRQDDYIRQQDEYIARIINHSYLRNERNMERIDGVMEQQNKLIEMVVDQNRRTQDRADRLIDMIMEKKL